MAEIIFVNTYIVVLNKPAGMPSHPLLENEGNTALDFVVAKYPEVAKASINHREGGLIHRLDTNTSGLLMFARDEVSYYKLRALLKNNEIKKTYLALVHGVIEENLVLSSPIAHHPKSRKKMMVIGEGRRYFRGKAQSATTHVSVLATGNNASLVRVAIEGGRRHQIRVHLAAAGHVLIGDELYGGPAARHLPGHALHAESIILPDATVVLAPAPPELVSEAREYGISID